MSKHIVYIQTGSNQGNRYDYLKKAISLIEATGSVLVNASPVYETAAWGPIRQTAFLNQILVVSTSLEPEILMLKLLDIEKQMGRIREEKMGPRIIDIDIIFFDDIVYQSANLTIPHPLLHQRKFVLLPLCSINPDLLHPVFRKTVKELLDECMDILEVTKWDWDQEV